MANPVTAAELLAHLDDTHARTLRLVADLSPDQMLGPRLPTVNPPNWEIGHLAWFTEYWILRNLDGSAPLMPEADRLYDSSAVAHDRRWNLPLPPVADTFAYLQAVKDALQRRLGNHGDPVPEKDRS
ncbi:MAG: DinB family protein, partial [Acidiferrobacterales bacterium]